MKVGGCGNVRGCNCVGSSVYINALFWVFLNWISLVYLKSRTLPFLILFDVGNESVDQTFLAEKEYRIGTQECEIQILDNDSVSRFHARISVHVPEFSPPGIEHTRCKIQILDNDSVSRFHARISVHVPEFSPPGIEHTRCKIQILDNDSVSRFQARISVYVPGFSPPGKVLRSIQLLDNDSFGVPRLCCSCAEGNPSNPSGRAVAQCDIVWYTDSAQRLSKPTPSRSMCQCQC